MDINVFPQAYLFLIAYWLLFWRKFLWNPYLLCTSEIASTFFPHWRWMGLELRAGKFPSQDDIFYKLPGSIPFLATFYPPNLITAYLGSFLKEDHAFRLYAYFIILHFLLCSFFAYGLFGNLFAALTLAYAGYVIKPNTPTFVFTATWVPLALKGVVLGALAFNMSLLGGYYPILVYVLPVVAVIAPYSLFGAFLAAPQLIPFLGYFKRSVRMGEKVDKNFGRLPWYRLFDLINPSRFIGTVNGVHYPEVMMYMGIAPFFIFHFSWWWLPLFCSLLIVLGMLPSIQRIPGRAIYLLSFSIAVLASQNLQEASSLCKSLILFQAFLLLRNSSIYPSFPFNQWWDKPSKLYAKKPKSYNWPFVTGYREGARISDYAGAFRLAN